MTFKVSHDGCNCDSRTYDFGLDWEPHDDDCQIQHYNHISTGRYVKNCRKCDAKDNGASECD